MHHKKTDKRYVYIREGGECFFCQKKLLFKQISLDHYLPRSQNGPGDVFNLVLSCKKCNKIKKSTIPPDYQEVMVHLFKKAVEDGIIVGRELTIKQKDMKALAANVTHVEQTGEYTLFFGGSYRFYVRDNQVIKLIHIGKWRPEV